MDKVNNYGLFLRVNYQDGLNVGNITDCKVGGILIKNVPHSYNETDIETILLCYGQGLEFGENLHQNLILKEQDFPDNVRFNQTIEFNSCLLAAIKHLSKLREMKNNKQ